MVRTRFAVLVLLLAACAPAEPRPGVGDAPAQELVWPLPPDEPRIRYLYAFGDPEDLGFRPSFFERIVRLFAGEEQRGMVRPHTVAAAEGMIAVADPGLKALHLFDIEAEGYQRITAVAEQELVSPVGVGIGGGRIFVADSALGKVFILDRDGDHLGTIAGLQRPTGIAYHGGTGRVYVAETLAHRIAAFDRRGARLLSFGKRGKEAGEFNYPSHLAVHGDNLYVTDTMNFRVQTFDLEGKFVSSFGKLGDGTGYFAQPKGVAADAAGHIYVVDALFDRVQVFDPGGRLLLVFGQQGQRAGEFWLPAGVFIAGDKIFVADSYNQRIQVFKYLGSKS